MNKKYIIGYILGAVSFLGLMGLVANAAPVTPITGGGTQTSTAPLNGYLLIGNPNGTYSFIASSSLSGGGSVSGTSTDICVFNSSSTCIGYDNFQYISSSNALFSNNPAPFYVSSTGQMYIGGKGGALIDIGAGTGGGGEINIQSARTWPIVFTPSGNLVDFNATSGALDLSIANLTNTRTVNAPDENGTFAYGGGNGIAGNCAQWLDSNTVTSTSGPCGSGGGGGVATSSPFFSTGIVYNNNGSLSATSTFTVSTSTGLVSLLSLNGFVYAADFPGATFADQINAAYTALPISGGTIYAPCGTSSSTNSINFTGSSFKNAMLIGCGGGDFYHAGATSLVYNGTGTAIIDDGRGYEGLGIENLSLFGPAGIYSGGSTGIGSSTIPGSSTSTVGILAGTTNGAVGFLIEGVQISGFQVGVEFGTSTYVTSIDHSSIEKNGINVYYGAATNAFEKDSITNSVIADSNASTSTYPSIVSNCIYIANNNESGDWNLFNTSFDDCQLVDATIGQGVVIHDTNNHWENPNAATGVYPFITTPAGQARYLTIYSSGNYYITKGDRTTSNPIVNNGGTFVSSGDTINNYNTDTSDVTRFVNNQDSNDIFSWFGLAYTGLPGNTVYSYANNLYSAEGLGVGTAAPLFSISTSTIVLGENVSTTLAANSFVATNGQGILVTTSTPSGGSGGVATTTPFTAGYLPVTSSSLALTNSPIYENSSTQDITIGSTTDLGGPLNVVGSSYTIDGKYTGTGQYAASGIEFTGPSSLGSYGGTEIVQQNISASGATNGGLSINQVSATGTYVSTVMSTNYTSGTLDIFPITTFHATAGTSSTLQLTNGTKTTLAVASSGDITIGNTTAPACYAMYMNGSSTKFYLYIASSSGLLGGGGEDVFATSTVPAGC